MLFVVSVAALEQEHGWVITSAADTAVTIVYKRTLQLYFTPYSFQPSRGQADAAASQSISPISLAFIADADEYRPKPLTTEKRFFLQIMRAQLQFLEQSLISIDELLKFVSEGWEKACLIAEEARMLGVQYITEPSIVSDEHLVLSSVILLKAMRTKVEVGFEISARSREGVLGIDVAVKPKVKRIYGEELNETKLGEFLEQHIAGTKRAKNGHRTCWLEGVKELERRLIARGKRT